MMMIAGLLEIIRALDLVQERLRTEFQKSPMPGGWTLAAMGIDLQELCAGGGAYTLNRLRNGLESEERALVARAMDLAAD